MKYLTVYSTEYGHELGLKKKLVKCEFVYNDKLYNIRLKMGEDNSDVNFYTPDEVQSTRGGFPTVIKIPNIASFNEAEFFQASLVWDHFMDINLVLAVQKYLLQNVSSVGRTSLLNTIQY